MADGSLTGKAPILKGEVSGPPAASYRRKIRLSESDPVHTSGVPDHSGRVPLSHVLRPEKYEGLTVVLATSVVDEVLSSS